MSSDVAGAAVLCPGAGAAGSVPEISRGAAVASVRGLACAAWPNLVRKHPTSSGAMSVTFIPSDTRNLQLKIGRDWSSSASWQLTLQYWHSWFQQKRPYGTVSGLMN